jgi:hypothetical protein
VGVRTGKENRQLVGYKLINSSGVAESSGPTGGTCMEPSADEDEAVTYLSPSATAVANFGSDAIRASGAIAADTTYNAVTSLGGVFTVTRESEWDNATAVGSSWRSIGISDVITDAQGGERNGYVFLLNASLSKTATQTLTFTFGFSWTRSF